MAKKIMKNNEKDPNFLSDISATILQPPHYAKKKMKKCHGVAHGSAQTWKKS